MRSVTCQILALLALGAAPARAQDPAPPVCDAALIALAQARLAPEPQAMAFLRDATPVLDPAPEGGGAFDALFAQAADPQPAALDFVTGGAQAHDTCFEVNGTLWTGADAIADRSGRAVPVSVFVFEQAGLAANVTPGGTRTETNVRLKVGRFLLDPGLRGLSRPFTAAEDAFRDFSLSAYIAYDQQATLTGSLDRDGDHEWFAIDLRQGLGPQLAAVICDRPCGDYLDELKLRLLAANGPLAPPAAPEPRQTPEPPLPPEPEQPPAPQPVQGPDFVGERLDVIVLDHEGAVAASDDIDLGSWIDAQAFDDSRRRRLRDALDALHGDGGATAARAVLAELGLLTDALAALPVERAGHGYRIVLRLPEPPPPVLLSGVDVVLADPSGSPVLDHCRIEVEVTHPDHAPLVLETVLDLDNTDRTEAGDEKFLRFFTQDLPEAAILTEPAESLSLRAYPVAEFALFEGSQAKPSTCALSWAGRFPGRALALAELAGAAEIPALLTDDGTVILQNVALRSTARPVFVLLYNTTGLVDSNGAPLNPDLFPSWNSARGGRDLQAALGIMARAAHTLFSRRTDDVFIAEAAGGLDKGFRDIVPFAPETLARMAAGVKAGEVGPFNLENELRNLANSTSALPRFVILGRSGLPRETDYCGTLPDIPEEARAGSILIDFLGKDATFDLSSAAQMALRDPQGPEAFADAAHRLAARCPDDGTGLVHWVITPETADPLALLDNLETVATYIFGGLE